MCINPDPAKELEMWNCSSCRFIFVTLDEILVNLKSCMIFQVVVKLQIVVVKAALLFVKQHFPDNAPVTPHYHTRFFSHITTLMFLLFIYLCLHLLSSVNYLTWYWILFVTYSSVFQCIKAVFYFNLILTMFSNFPHFGDFSKSNEYSPSLYLSN